MRWLSKRPFGTLIVFSFALLLLTAACAGPQGDRGTTGSAGATGATGATGSQGSGGSTGSAGAGGSTGPTGPSGMPGPRGTAGTDGETLPASIIIVLAGEGTSVQPVIIDVSVNPRPELTIIGAGFNGGEIISVNIVSTTGESIMQFSGGGHFTQTGGAFRSNWRANADLAVGVYTIEVTVSPSGVKASAPLVMVTK